MLSAISNRRSIRKYQNKPVPKQLLQQILQAGRMAPSSKNRQPWKFIVVTGKAKQEMLIEMQKGLLQEKVQPLLPNSKRYLSGAEHTLQIMQQAPVIIFVINPLGLPLSATLTPEERIYEICNAQSIGAAIENMCLTATHLGLGSLWICDTYFSYSQLCSWLNTPGELFGALALGYAAEQPDARPRNAFETVVEWRDS